MLDAVCTHVTSSAASRDSAVKLTTDSYQFWVARLNLRVTFQSHIRFARKVQNYGDAFSKPSSILTVVNPVSSGSDIPYISLYSGHLGFGGDDWKN